MPINDLPTEILANVLKRCFGDFQKDYMAWANSRRRVLEICKRWRGVLIEDGAAWNHIYIDPRTHPDEVAQALKFSQQSSLVFHIAVFRALHSGPIATWIDVDTRISNIMAIISTSFVRCRQLVLFCSDEGHTLRFLGLLVPLSAPILECIRFEVEPPSLDAQADTLSIPHIFQGQLPLLQSLTFESNFIHWPNAPYYGNIRHICLSNLPRHDFPTLDELYPFFSSTPLLESLELGNLDCDLTYPVTVAVPTMQYLTHLKFASSHESGCIFLSNLKLPRLRVLFLHFDNETSYSVFLDHCCHLLRPLETLILCAIIFSSNQLSTTFAYLDNIRHIDLSPSMTYEGYVRFKGSSNGWPHTCISSLGHAVLEVIGTRRGLCPRLTSICIGDEEVCDDLVYKLLESADSPLGNNLRVTFFLNMGPRRFYYEARREHGCVVLYPVSSFPEYYIYTELLCRYGIFSHVDLDVYAFE